MISRHRKHALPALLALLLIPSAFGRTEQSTNAQVFGEQYRAVAPAAADQTQVVYYRPASDVLKAPGANLYINGHFHTSLLPGGFTTFCLPPGPHLLGAYQNDAPLYRGKTEELYRVNLDAGKTYFVKVSEDGKGIPVSVERQEAEQSLRNAREQKQAISRAATPACKSSL
ncbi:hypothetical protein [Pseudomonas sp. D(2018)]|uniref:hypothetical protein n=1 Tax=Pseudomonadaceae TaxID=135621 RepID=UPI0010F44A6F|nr:hypothetical protein [Pseudomonas sp. D(2018)]